MLFFGPIRLLPRLSGLIFPFLGLFLFVLFFIFLTSQATRDFLLSLQIIMATNPSRTEDNDSTNDEDEKKRPAHLNLAPGTCPNAPNINAPGAAAAACNQADCIVCTTVNLHSPYLPETPNPAIGEFWIRHIDSVFGMRTERQAEEMRACMEVGDRVINLANDFVAVQRQLIEEMRRINRSLDETLERSGAGDLDDDDDNVLHDPDVDNAIIDALTQLRNGGPVNGDGTQ